MDDSDLDWDRDGEWKVDMVGIYWSTGMQHGKWMPAGDWQYHVGSSTASLHLNGLTQSSTLIHDWLFMHLTQDLTLTKAMKSSPSYNPGQPGT